LDLRLDTVTISLGQKVLLSLSETIATGEVLTVMGPSGSGKSTLLAFVGGFLDPAFTASGRVWIDGHDVTNLPAEARHAGILFQDPLLFPHMTVAANLLFGLDAQVKGAQRREAVEAALDDFELGGLGSRDPATLSGGQRARVALARTLLSAPKALLLDEPFSKLYAPLRNSMRKLVFDAARRHGLPVLLVTHDEADAHAAGGKIVRLTA
jgi:putative thiamine transport system ATP-binding protein